MTPKAMRARCVTSSGHQASLGAAGDGGRQQQGHRDRGHRCADPVERRSSTIDGRGGPWPATRSIRALVQAQTPHPAADHSSSLGTRSPREVFTVRLRWSLTSISPPPSPALRQSTRRRNGSPLLPLPSPDPQGGYDNELT